MKNNVVVFDLDGTLLDCDNHIIGGTETLALLQKLQANNYRLAICTGRLDHDIVAINNLYDLNINERISQNGAVFYQGNHLEATLLDKHSALALNQLLKNYPDVRVEMNTISNRYWHSDRDPNFPKEFYDSSIITQQDYGDIIPFQPVILFLIVGQTEDLKAIQKEIIGRYENVDAIMTSATSLEVVPQGISKGKALERMYPEACVYAIGDSESDTSMAQYAKQFYYAGEGFDDGMKVNTITEALEDIVKKAGI